MSLVEQLTERIEEIKSLLFVDVADDFPYKKILDDSYLQIFNETRHLSNGMSELDVCHHNSEEERQLYEHKMQQFADSITERIKLTISTSHLQMYIAYTSCIAVRKLLLKLNEYGCAIDNIKATDIYAITSNDDMDAKESTFNTIRDELNSIQDERDNVYDKPTTLYRLINCDDINNHPEVIKRRHMFISINNRICRLIDLYRNYFSFYIIHHQDMGAFLLNTKVCESPLLAFIYIKDKIAPEKLSYLKPYISSNDWCTSSDMDEIELSSNVTDPMALIAEINYHLGASFTVVPMSNYIHPQEGDVT
jgi:hypothetical protein|nr:MAG TPA: hypothetical protein [Caudoviricetes sp.]